MATQFDYQTPVDLLSLSSVTQAQLDQAINTIRPLPNIGGILVGSGAGSAHPDVTNNPRFIRYIWLDTQNTGAIVIKIYQGTYPSDTYADWSTLVIADDSITAAKIADYAVSILNNSSLPKIAYKQDGTADATKSNFLVRLDAAGQYVEVVNAATVVGALTLNPAKIDITSASNGMFLGYSSSLGYATWQAISISGLIAANTIPYDRLVNGTAGYIMRAGVTGVMELANNDDSASTLFPVRTIGLTKLALGGAVNNDKIRCNGTDWVKYTPFYADSGSTVPSAATGGALSAAHGLGATPRIYGAFLLCTTGDLGYAVGDKVDARSLISRTATPENFTGTTLWANATTVGCIFHNAATYRLFNKTTFAVGTLTSGSWEVYFYAEL